MSFPIGLQLYTLREEMAQDFSGVLEEVAQIGYQGVEFAGYGGYSAPELKDLLDDLDLEAVGSHVPLEDLREDLSEVLDFNRVIGNKNIVCPWAELHEEEDFLQAAEEFQEIGKRCRENGFRFCYHNHNHELVKFDQGRGLDLLFQNTDPELLHAELDTFWIYYEKLDPVSYVRRYEDRTPLVHLKDMDSMESKNFAPVGEGIIEFEPIIRAAEGTSVEWMIVEQDQTEGPALESVRKSFENLKEMGLGS